MQYTVNLTANVWTTQAVPGKYFALIDTGAAAAIEVRIMRGSQEVGSLRTARRGLQADVAESFGLVMFRSSVNTVVECFISDGSMKVDTVDGAAVLATIINDPLVVRTERGDPAQPLHVVGMTADDAPAVSFTEPAAVAITGGLTAVIGASATRSSLRFINHGPDQVAIGGAGLSWAKRAIVLDVGDGWEENRGANLAWSAVCDAGKTATIGVQGINK